jgi:hypothetical protein
MVIRQPTDGVFFLSLTRKDWEAMFESKAFRNWGRPASRIAKTSGERVPTQQAANILGLKPRKLQGMSQRGEIPGAAKIGRQWTYDVAKLRHYVELQERVSTCQGRAKRQPDAIGAGIPSGAALRCVGGSSAGRLQRMIQQSQKRVAKLAKPAP